MEYALRSEMENTGRKSEIITYYDGASCVYLHTRAFSLINSAESFDGDGIGFNIEFHMLPSRFSAQNNCFFML